VLSKTVSKLFHKNTWTPSFHTTFNSINPSYIMQARVKSYVINIFTLWLV